MNKDKRKALIDNINRQLSIGAFKTADDYVIFAGELADLQSHGRTQRWKGACTMAGRRILIKADSGAVTIGEAEHYVRQGVEAMALANK